MVSIIYIYGEYMVYPDYFIPQLPAIRRSQEVQAANWGPWAGWTTHRAWGAVAFRLGIAEVVMISYDKPHKLSS